MISPFSIEEVINADCSASNLDWLRAARLRERANEAARKLEELDDADVVRYHEDEG
jgi:hypothetical protein